MNKTRTKPNGEMSEKNLIEIAKIFFDKSNIKTQIRFKYDKTNNRKFYAVDCLIEKRKTIFEYDGPHHYCNIGKIKRDIERYAFFKKRGYRIFGFPYFCQLTRDLAKFIFKDFYSEEKYIKSIKKVYGVNKEENILAPGLHSSKETPANFISLGMDRFLNEMKQFPESQVHQIIYSLQLYAKDYSLEYIIPKNDRFIKFINTKVKDKYKKIWYKRELNL